MSDQRKVIERLTEEIREAVVRNGHNLAPLVTENYDKLMGQAIDDVTTFFERQFGGNGQLNYTDYKRLQLDKLEMEMLKPYLNQLQKNTVENMEQILEQTYWDSYRMNVWALDQTTPPTVKVMALADLNADPMTNFYLQTWLKSQVMVPWYGAMFSQRLGVINDKMARNIQDLTDAGMVNGWSTQDLSIRMRDLVGIPAGQKLKTRPRASAAKSRADMIARTEMMRAADVAKEYLFSQNRHIVEDERWKTSDLGNVCPRCLWLGLQNDGKGALFSKINQRPPLHPRCACTGIPVLASWGKLLGADYKGMKDEGIDEWEMKHPDPESGKFVSARITPYNEWLAQAA